MYYFIKKTILLIMLTLYISPIQASKHITTKMQTMRGGPDYFQDSQPPDFSLVDSNGKTKTLKDYLGRKVILCFFDILHANDSEIIKQLRALQGAYQQLQICSIDVIIITPTTTKILDEINRIHNFPFTFLLDEQKSVPSRYGAIEYGYVTQSTLILNEQGIVVATVLSNEASDHLTEIFFYALRQAKATS
ncbi:redoxin domain-containing protein [Candidatus Babeliales bacterium]|nr:redoxin domain-containing protein [Candidatus Babeliales bacterium]